MARETILIVEDEKEILELVRYNLAKEQYSVRCAGSGEDGLREARASLPDLVVLDLMLPGVDGLEVCKTLRGSSATQNIPIVMLTAKGEETDIVAGLELGADDYITKPFSPRVLVARIRAVLRRRAAVPDEQPEVIRINNLVIHCGRFEVLVDNQPVKLTRTEFRVLLALVSRPGWVLTRQQIAVAVHGEENVVTDRSVDVQIVALRQKLKSAGQWIETVRGIGYRFKE